MPRVNILTHGLGTSVSPAEIQYIRDLIKSWDNDRISTIVKDDKK